jgi:hypothetical protein
MEQQIILSIDLQTPPDVDAEAYLKPFFAVYAVEIDNDPNRAQAVLTNVCDPPPVHKTVFCYIDRNDLAFENIPSSAICFVRSSAEHAKLKAMGVAEAHVIGNLFADDLAALRMAEIVRVLLRASA